MKPYYQDDYATIYHGDCLDVLDNGLAYDTVFTSPPYNLGDMAGGLANLAGGYRSYDDTRRDYDAWQSDLLRRLWADIPDDGVIFYNHKPIVRDGVVSLPTRLVPPGVVVRQIVVWYRQMGVNWSPTHFLPVHEWVIVCAKPRWKLASKTASHVSDVWPIRPDMGNNEHPAPFPLQLPLTALGACSPRVVLDPFAGSGTTLRAAKDLGVKCIGIELDERYCEIAAKRLCQEVLDFGGAA